MRSFEVLTGFAIERHVRRARQGIEDVAQALEQDLPRRSTP